MPKPRHLGPGYASQFSDPSVVEAYRHRPPYPPGTFDLLAELIVDPAGAVLDAGCGSGFLARPLAARVGRVDAVDPSAGMIAAGRRLPGGGHPHLRWIEAPMESAPLRPPYALAVAGESLHWMDWGIVLPRIRAALLPDARLVVIGKEFSSVPWEEELAALIARYSTNREFEPYDLVTELTTRGLFRVEGERRTKPAPLHSTVEDYVESFHSSNGFSRDRMAPEDAAAFDAAVKQLAQTAHPEGRFSLEVRARLVWGRPSGPAIP